jgi:hypothetical protein
MAIEYSDEINRRLRELAEVDLYNSRKPKADVAGKRFGRLVIQRGVGHGQNGRLIVLCHCDCGKAKITLYDALLNGVKSCGCLLEEMQPTRKRNRLAGELMLRTLKRLNSEPRISHSPESDETSDT